MLNTALEKNHEEMLELHFKLELMEYQLVKNKHQIFSPQALMAKVKLIMGCDDANYRIKLGSSPMSDAYSNSNYHHDQGFNHQHQQLDRMGQRSNFWGELIEMPQSHSYSTQEDLSQARGQLKRWSDEWKEKKIAEMELFNGKREISINEGETASTVSASRISNKQEKAAQLHQDALREHGGEKKYKK